MDLNTLAWLISVPLIAVLHELGHALAARPAGYRVTSFGIGHGKPLLHWETRRGVIVYLGRWLVSGGMCVAIPVEPLPSRRWLYHSGGLLMQGVLALALWPLSQRFPALEGAMVFNLLVLAWNLLPLRLGGYATDGWHLVAPWLGGSRAGQFYAQRAHVERVLRLEEANHSALGVHWCRLMLEWMDTVTGQEPQDWEPEELILMSEPQLEGLITYIRAEQERMEGASLGALQRIQAHRRDMAGALPGRVRDMLALSEARAWNAQGSPKKARELLSQVAGVGGALGREALVVQLEAALQEGEPALIAAACERLRASTEGAFLDLPAAAIALYEGAQELKEQGQLQAAETTALAARAAANRALAAALPEDRLPLAARLGAVAGVEIVPERPRLWRRRQSPP